MHRSISRSILLFVLIVLVHCEEGFNLEECNKCFQIEGAKACPDEKGDCLKSGEECPKTSNLENYHCDKQTAFERWPWFWAITGAFLFILLIVLAVVIIIRYVQYKKKNCSGDGSDRKSKYLQKESKEGENNDNMTPDKGGEKKNATGDLESAEKMRNKAK